MIKSAAMTVTIALASCEVSKWPASHRAEMIEDLRSFAHLLHSADVDCPRATYIVRRADVETGECEPDGLTRLCTRTARSQTPP